MKTVIIYSAVISIGGVVSSFTWVPPALNSARDWSNEPMVSAIQAQTAVMAGMKHYDIRTDELADDVRDMKASIRELEREKAETPDISPAHARSLERQIEQYKKKLYQKARQLDRATTTDQKILSELTGLAS